MKISKIEMRRKMGKEKLLSVIVPVYNVEAYLLECVDAVSYTHLDVYKRQCMNRAEFIWTWMWS